MLDKRWRLRPVDVRDWGRFFVDAFITPRHGFEILPRKRVNVGLDVVRQLVSLLALSGLIFRLCQERARLRFR